MEVLLHTPQVDLAINLSSVKLSKGFSDLRYLELFDET